MVSDDRVDLHTVLSRIATFWGDWTTASARGRDFVDTLWVALLDRHPGPVATLPVATAVSFLDGASGLGDGPGRLIGISEYKDTASADHHLAGRRRRLLRRARGPRGPRLGAGPAPAGAPGAAAARDRGEPWAGTSPPRSTCWMRPRDLTASADHRTRGPGAVVVTADGVSETGAVESSWAGDRLVGELVRRGIGGAGPWHSARRVAPGHLAEADGDVETAVRRLISTDVRLAASSGLLTSLGGAATMVVTAPAGVTGLYLVSTRLAAAIRPSAATTRRPRGAHRGPAVVLGPDRSELAQPTGIDLQESRCSPDCGGCPPRSRPSSTAHGYRLAGRAGRRGVLDLTKLIPLVAGPIGAGADDIAARSVATYADVTFWSRRTPPHRVIHGASGCA